MANLLASRKCAVLTSDSFKEALYLNEGCTHRSRARGEVQGSMRPLIKAEHPSPVFRTHLKSQRGRSLKLAESPVVRRCCGLSGPALRLTGCWGAGVARRGLGERRPGFFGFFLGPAPCLAGLAHSHRPERHRRRVHPVSECCRKP